MKRIGQHFRLYLLIKKVLNLVEWIIRRGKYYAFTVATCSNGKALELGAECLISEALLYLNGAIHHTGWCLIGEVLRSVYGFLFFYSAVGEQVQK